MSTEQIRQDCWDKATYAFATAYIFEQRLKSTRKKLKLLTFLGVAVPATVGGIVVTFFGVEGSRPYLSILIIIAGVLGTIQLVFSIWALVAKWDDEAAYASSSIVENRRLASQFSELGKLNPSDLELQYRFLKAENTRREELDIQRGITEKEQRMGHRAGLRQFQKTCPGCGKTPTDMKPSDCLVCGNF